MSLNLSREALASAVRTLASAVRAEAAADRAVKAAKASADPDLMGPACQVAWDCTRKRLKAQKAARAANRWTSAETAKALAE
jgi:hypothetical protein